MSLLDELEADVAANRGPRSQIEVFLDKLPKKDRAQFDTWLAEGGNNSLAMWRVLKRRGLPVAESTFRNWTMKQCH